MEYDNIFPTINITMTQDNDLSRAFGAVKLLSTKCWGQESHLCIYFRTIHKVWSSNSNQSDCTPYNTTHPRHHFFPSFWLTNWAHSSLVQSTLILVDSAVPFSFLSIITYHPPSLCCCPSSTIYWCIVEPYLMACGMNPEDGAARSYCAGLNPFRSFLSFIATH